MKTVDCKIVSQEIDELERGQEPSQAVREHARVCAPCQSFYDNRLKLRQMVAGLGAVEAPPDFDFRLRARLASEKKRVPRFSPVIFGFGLPSIALATIAVLFGAGLLMRALTGPESNPPLVQDQSPRVAEPGTAAAPATPELLKANVTVAATPSAKHAPSVKKQRTVGPKANEHLALAAAGNRRQVATKDFSSNQAEVFKREDLLAETEHAAIFPLEASEPLRVSLDYATGGSRTISLPTLSFGSQQVVSRGASLMKSSARTVW